MMSDSNASNNSAGAGADGSGGPCGACKFLRRKCAAGCIFAPYFDSEQGPAHFAAVHKVFGASNFSKLLLHIPAQRRPDAVVSVCYEARARLGDPVYGCVAHIFALQKQVVNLQAELSYLQAHLSTVETPSPPPAALPPPVSFSIEDLPTSLAMPTTYDLSSLFMDPAETHHPRRGVDPHLTTSSVGSGNASSSSANSGDGDLQELARELLNKTVACMNNQAPNLPPHRR